MHSDNGLLGNKPIPNVRLCDPGPCITNVFATRRKNFSQWYRSFQRKLLSHWLKFLRHVAITLVIQGPGPQRHMASLDHSQMFMFWRARLCVQNNIERHTAHTIVSWLNHIYIYIYIYDNMYKNELAYILRRGRAIIFSNTCYLIRMNYQLVRVR